MRLEREEIFEKDSALEDACGMLMKEKQYLQSQLAKAISVFTAHQERMLERLNVIEQRSPSMVSVPSDQEHH